jgi:hypothetical protein
VGAYVLVFSMKLADNLIDWDTVPSGSVPTAINHTEQNLSQIEMAIVTQSEKLAALENGLLPMSNAEVVKECLLNEINRLENDREVFLRIKAIQELGI